MICRREAEALEWDGNAPRRHCRRWRPRRILIASDRHRRHLLEHDGAFEPAEELRQLVKEALEWRKRRELMSEHVLPVRLKRRDKSRLRESRSSRDGHRLCLALLF